MPRQKKQRTRRGRKPAPTVKIKVKHNLPQKMSKNKRKKIVDDEQIQGTSYGDESSIDDVTIDNLLESRQPVVSEPSEEVALSNSSNPKASRSGYNFISKEPEFYEYTDFERLKQRIELRATNHESYPVKYVGSSAVKCLSRNLRSWIDHIIIKCIEASRASRVGDEIVSPSSIPGTISFFKYKAMREFEGEKDPELLTVCTNNPLYDFLAEHGHYEKKYEEIIANIKKNRFDQFEARQVFDFLKKNKNARFTKEQISDVMKIIESRKYEEAEKKKIAAKHRVDLTMDPNKAIEHFTRMGRPKKDKKVKDINQGNPIPSLDSLIDPKDKGAVGELFPSTVEPEVSAVGPEKRLNIHHSLSLEADHDQVKFLKSQQLYHRSHALEFHSVIRIRHLIYVLEQMGMQDSELYYKALEKQQFDRD
ncbi:unnamed protein product [Moneuplotes crassus]|uniref:Uncharacterized protein n=1 Tax=Euplotes crassus TaxID=5936 RepID=A0AAD1UAS0_EUPCR|nr:unnamed protein product [Moneuplotes crassus]